MKLNDVGPFFVSGEPKYVSETGRATYCLLPLTELYSYKSKKDGKYVTTGSCNYYAKIYGDQVEDALLLMYDKDTNRGDRIQLKNAVLELPYDKENKKNYINLTVFEFEKLN